MPEVALFMNGIYSGVLETILESQLTAPEETFYLQPFTGTAIKMLRDKTPSPAAPLTLYASVTGDLNKVAYTAQVVGWEDKTRMTQRRQEEVIQALRKYQPGETGYNMEEAGLYNESGTPGKPSINLIHIRRLFQYDPPFSVSRLIKTNDGNPLADNRTRGGGWSYVNKLV